MRTSCAAIAILTVACAGCIACGYSLAGRGSFLPAHIKVVGIPELQNRTPVSGIEAIFTRKIREEFQGRGKYQVRSDRSGADAVLTGEILLVTQVPAGTTDTQLASRYRYTVTMKFAFTDVTTSKVLWSNDAFVLSEEYQITSQESFKGGTLVNQLPSSTDRLATDAARTVVTSITEAF